MPRSSTGFQPVHLKMNHEVTKTQSGCRASKTASCLCALVVQKKGSISRSRWVRGRFGKVSRDQPQRDLSEHEGLSQNPNRRQFGGDQMENEREEKNDGGEEKDQSNRIDEPGHPRRLRA